MQNLYNYLQTEKQTHQQAMVKVDDLQIQLEQICIERSKTEFQIQSPAGFLVNGEYQENTDSRKIIIFSHGFGVTRKARDLFDDITAILKDKYLCVLFDYNLKLENSIKVDSVSEQAEILKAVYKYLKHEFGWFECSLIGHSLGTIAIGLADLPDISKIILLLPSHP
jgi:pimeloyl-ACP methyl ester carboxylesterase